MKSRQSQKTKSQRKQSQQNWKPKKQKNLSQRKRNQKNRHYKTERVSTEEERQLNALEKQIQENRDVISNNGWILVGEYIDEGKTGTTTKRRSAYKHLLADMTEGKFDIVVCKDQDRLQRNTLDWYLFVDNLVKNNLKLFMYLDNKFFIPSEDALITGIKAIILLDYAERHGDIADPWYTGDFTTTYFDIVRGCEGFLTFLEQEGKL